MSVWTRIYGFLENYSSKLRALKEEVCGSRNAIYVERIKWCIILGAIISYTVNLLLQIESISKLFSIVESYHRIRTKKFHAKQILMNYRLQNAKNKLLILGEKQ